MNKIENVNWGPGAYDGDVALWTTYENITNSLLSKLFPMHIFIYRIYHNKQTKFKVMRDKC